MAAMFGDRKEWLGRNATLVQSNTRAFFCIADIKAWVIFEALCKRYPHFVTQPPAPYHGR